MHGVSTNLHTEIDTVVDFIENHVLLGDLERTNLEAILQKWQSGCDPGTILEQLKVIKHELKLKEIGDVKKRTINAYGTDLVDDEVQLKRSIAGEKRGQYLVVFLVTALMLVFSLYLAYICYYIVTQKDVAITIMILQTLVIFIIATILYYLFRIFQNAREAAERMDEKTIGITFLIYGLKFMAANPNNDAILKVAAQMFLGHQGVSSKTLSDKDYSEFSTGILRIFNSLGSHKKTSKAPKGA